MRMNDFKITLDEITDMVYNNYTEENKEYLNEQVRKCLEYINELKEQKNDN